MHAFKTDIPQHLHEFHIPYLAYDKSNIFSEAAFFLFQITPLWKMLWAIFEWQVKFVSLKKSKLIFKTRAR